MYLKILNSEYRCKVGEGPLWDEKNGELLFVDILGECIFKLDYASGNIKKIDVGQQVGCLALCENGDILLAMQDGVYRMTSNGDIKLAHAPVNIKGRRFNDGKVGPDGCFYVGTADDFGEGAFYRLQNGVLTELFDKCGCSNGLDWSNDGKKMFYCDTPRGMIEVFDFDADTHSLSGRRCFAKIPKELGLPDGFSMDENENIWLGLWDGGAILEIRADASFGEKLEVPAKKASCCAFAGDTLSDLVITTAAKNDTDEFPLAGYVFKKEMTVKGKKTFRYRG